MRLCARTLAVDGQVCEYARVKVVVPVRWCMSASVRSHVWAMVSALVFWSTLWCVLVCVSLCVCVYVCTRFVKGRPIRRTFLFAHVDLAIRRHSFFTRFGKNFPLKR